MRCKQLLERWYKVHEAEIQVAPVEVVRRGLHSSKMLDMLSRDTLLKDIDIKDLIKKIETDNIIKEFIIPSMKDIGAVVNRSEASVRSGVSMADVEKHGAYSTYIPMGHKSTFPQWFGEYFPGATKKSFLSALKSGRSKMFDNIVILAVETLLHGREDYDQKNDENFKFMDSLGIVPF